MNGVRAIMILSAALCLTVAACSSRQRMSTSVAGKPDTKTEMGDSVPKVMIPPMVRIEVDTLAETENDELPQFLEIEAPVYPPAYKDKGLTGTVDLSLLIDRDGVVRYVSVNRSDLPKIFELYAIQAALKFKFSPARRHGVAVNSRVCHAPILFEGSKK